MEIECSYRERVPFSSFTVMHRKPLEESFEELEKIDLSTSEADLRALAKALSKIKLMNDIETNPGPTTELFPDCNVCLNIISSSRRTSSYQLSDVGEPVPTGY